MKRFHQVVVDGGNACRVAAHLADAEDSHVRSGERSPFGIARVKGEERENRTSTMWVVTEELPIVSVSVMIPPDALIVTTEDS